jgi:hypothetical protein
MGQVTKYKYIVTQHLKGGIAEPEETVVVRQWLSKQAPLAMDMHATTEELLEAVFSMRPMPRLYDDAGGSVSVCLKALRAIRQ